MTCDDYIRIFDSFIDNEIGCGILLTGHFPREIKYNILEHLSLRLQVELQKNVCIISNEIFSSGLTIFTDNDDPYKFIPENDCVFLCLLKKPYFSHNVWYETVIKQLQYYKKSFFGFTTGEQKIVFYEED